MGVLVRQDKSTEWHQESLNSQFSSLKQENKKQQTFNHHSDNKSFILMEDSNSDKFKSIEFHQMLQTENTVYSPNIDHSPNQEIFEFIKLQDEKYQKMKFKQISEWKIEDTITFLLGTGLSQYKDIFEQKQIFGESLSNLTEEQLKKDLNMKSLGHRKTLLAELKNFKQGTTSQYNSISIKEDLQKLRQTYEKNVQFGLQKQYSSLNILQQKQKSIQLANRLNQNKQVEHSIDADIEDNVKEIKNEKIKETSQELKLNDVQSPSINQMKKSNFKSSTSSNKSNYSLDPNSSISSIIFLRKGNDDKQITKRVQKDYQIQSMCQTYDQDSKQSNNFQYLEDKVEKKNTQKIKKAKNEKTDKVTKVQTMIQYLQYHDLGKCLIEHSEIKQLEKIGEGGFGEVYKGEWLGQDIAIKSFGRKKRNIKKKRLANFVKEIQINTQLRHPNIVLYMGVCVDSNNFYMITEFLSQGSLFDHLHKIQTKFTLDQIIDMCEDIALGMVYLHDRKVLHCDLKSSNILLSDSWDIKLCDFGLSQVKTQINKKQGLIGTPNWMAPEIMRGEEYDEFSDVYSYGMILWELYTQEIPWNGMHVIDLIDQVGYQNKQIAFQKLNKFPFSSLVENCLQPKRQNRPTFKHILQTIQDYKEEQEQQMALRQVNRRM